MQLEVVGYGLKSYFKSDSFVFKFDLGFSHILEYESSYTFFLSRKLYGKRYLLVVSIFRNSVQNFVYNLFRIRPYLRYKFKGYKLTNETLRLKVGKKKQFF